MSKIIKRNNGSFDKLPDEEAKKLVEIGKAKYYDLMKGLEEPPANKAFLVPKKKKGK